jgi:holo-[acyl-carrier protein] synthase
MGVHVGLDLIEVSDVEESLRVHRARYLERVYTPREVADCRRATGTVDARGLAERFAAKEATLKALRAGERAIPWRSVEVVSDERGRLSLALTAVAAELAQERGIVELALSVTKAAGNAAAIVIARDGGSG